jgi:hypothetical protein
MLQPGRNSLVRVYALTHPTPLLVGGISLLPGKDKFFLFPFHFGYSWEAANSVFTLGNRGPDNPYSGDSDVVVWGHGRHPKSMQPTQTKARTA